jgi:hypothetical protein
LSSFPIEDGYLWFQALPEPSGRQPGSVLRQSEFMSALIDLTSRLRGVEGIDTTDSQMDSLRPVFWFEENHQTKIAKMEMLD